MALALTYGMPRRMRRGLAGHVLHVMNRSVRRAPLLSEPADYEGLLRAVREARAAAPLPIIAACLMPNHFHLVVRPETDEQLSEFMRRATGMHALRWLGSRGAAGTGAVYGGRFKAFPVQFGPRVLDVCRYVERNALRAGIVARAEEWAWGSLQWRLRGEHLDLLAPPPVPFPDDWRDRVNRPEDVAEVHRIRKSAWKGTPYGEAPWVLATAAQLGLQHTLRGPGRPRKLEQECLIEQEA